WSAFTAAIALCEARGIRGGLGQNHHNENSLHEPDTTDPPGRLKLREDPATDAGNGCYRLERGLLKVIITSPQGEERILAILGRGNRRRDLSIIDGRPRSASVIAIDDCDLTFISQQNFEKYIKQDPDI